jgi:hypothetical protein
MLEGFAMFMLSIALCPENNGHAAYTR